MKRTVIAYIVTFTIFSIIFLTLFRLPFHLFNDVLFYKGLTYLIITTLLLTVVVIVLYETNRNIKIESLIAAILVSASIHLSVFVVFPVTFERSVTMYLLNTINNQNDKGISNSALEYKLINDYIIDGKAPNKRIKEQSIIGFIEESDSKITLSDKAIKFLYFSKTIKNIYSLN
jgi:hypothetical protein